MRKPHTKCNSFLLFISDLAFSLLCVIILKLQGRSLLALLCNQSSLSRICCCWCCNLYPNASHVLALWKIRVSRNFDDLKNLFLVLLFQLDLNIVLVNNCLSPIPFLECCLSPYNYYPEGDSPAWSQVYLRIVMAFQRKMIVRSKSLFTINELFAPFLFYWI